MPLVQDGTEHIPGPREIDGLETGNMGGYGREMSIPGPIVSPTTGGNDVHSLEVATATATAT